MHLFPPTQSAPRFPRNARHRLFRTVMRFPPARLPIHPLSGYCSPDNIVFRFASPFHPHGRGLLRLQTNSLRGSRWDHSLRIAFPATPGNRPQCRNRPPRRPTRPTRPARHQGTPDNGRHSNAGDKEELKTEKAGGSGSWRQGPPQEAEGTKNPRLERTRADS